MSVQTAERVSFTKASDNVIYQRHLIAYEEAKKYVKGKTLEIGCGEGYGIEILSPLAEKYVAVDKYLADFTTTFSEKNNIEFHQITVPPLSIFEDNTFDTVVTFQVIEHIENDVAFVSEIFRVLKPGGTALITTPNKAMSLTRNPWHIREYLTNELESLIKKDFNSVEMLGLFGNEKVKEYYEANKKSVEKLTRFDVFNLQYRLPRQVLQVPYDLLNRWNRKKLLKENTNLTNNIQLTDYFYEKVNNECLDFFAIAKK